MLDNSKIETTDWLTKGIGEKQLQKEKKKALKEFDRIQKKKEKMKSDCYFDECKHCINKEYNDDLVCCLSSRLSLAWHKLLLEIPIINKFIDKHKFCYMFEEE